MAVEDEVTAGQFAGTTLTGVEKPAVVPTFALESSV